MSDLFVQEIKEILQKARSKAYKATSNAMIEAYWLMGQRIVVEEQDG